MLTSVARRQSKQQQLKMIRASPDSTLKPMRMISLINLLLSKLKAPTNMSEINREKVRSKITNKIIPAIKNLFSEQ